MLRRRQWPVTPPRPLQRLLPSAAPAGMQPASQSERRGPTAQATADCSNQPRRCQLPQLTLQRALPELLPGPCRRIPRPLRLRRGRRAVRRCLEPAGAPALLSTIPVPGGQQRRRPRGSLPPGSRRLRSRPRAVMTAARRTVTGAAPVPRVAARGDSWVPGCGACRRRACFGLRSLPLPGQAAAAVRALPTLLTS